ncbi:MAG TPA: PadR family transcriptional regulator [Actinomycetota bacterium]|jgi:DNA-binding PadR family transcriptional regulator|nr:PadR family transcriptional regulator [Actinomycetota bacterium]
MSRGEDGLTVTSYAILGLLAIQPWTTYELAQQMRRGLRRFWPRAESRIYEEPKRLVVEGLARSTTEFTGRRSSTTYAITPKGRRRLARWLAEPGAGPQLEFELLLKVWLSEHGTTADVMTNIAAIRMWAEERNAENITFAREYLHTGGPFPERLAQIILVGKFLTDFADMVASWSKWAEEVVGRWPEDPRGAKPHLPTLESIAARE